MPPAYRTFNRGLTNQRKPKSGQYHQSTINASCRTTSASSVSASVNAFGRSFVSFPAVLMLALPLAPVSDAAEKLSDLRGAFRVSFNHDASRVIAISREGALTIWALPAGTPVTGDLNPGAIADGFVMSSDAKLVLVGFEDGQCRVFDASNAKALSPLLDFRLSAESQMPGLFSPDASTLLLFSNKEAVAFDIRSGERRATFPMGANTDDDAKGSAAFTKDGARCFVMDGSGTVTPHDTKNWKPSGPPMMHPKANAACDYGFSLSDDGKWLATFDDPGENGPKSNLQVWDATTSKTVGKPLVAVNGMTGRFVGINRLLILPGRGEAAVRDLPSLKIAYTLRPHDEVDAPNAVISPDGKWILVWGADRGLDLVDAASGKFVHGYQSAARISKVLVMPDSSACCVLFDNSVFFLQGYHDNYLVKLSFPEMEITKTLRILDYVLSVSLSPDGEQIMVQQGETDQERLLFFEAESFKPIE